MRGLPRIITPWRARHPGMTLSEFTRAGGPHAWDAHGVAYRFPLPTDGGYPTLAQPDVALWWCIRKRETRRGAHAPEPGAIVPMLGRSRVLGHVRLGGVYTRPSGASGMAYVDGSTPELDMLRARVLARANRV